MKKMKITMMQKLLATFICLMLGSIVAISGMYYSFFTHYIEMQARKQSEIAFDLVFDSIRKKVTDSLPQIETFIKDTVEGNLNIINAPQERYDFASMTDEQLHQYLPSIFSRYRNIVSAVDQFAPLLGANKLVIYDKKRKTMVKSLAEAKEKAEAANRANSVFLANMTHELRTPLNAVLGFSQLMQNDSNTTETQRETLQIINRSGEHLLTLINDVLDMSKIEAGRSTLEPEDFDLGGMIRDIIDLMGHRAEAKGLQLILDQSSAFPRYIHADPAKLRQMLINLLGNAVKYTNEGGITLRLGATSTDDSKVRLAFEVEDSGIGIAEEDLECIFEPFAQVGEQTDTKGTGLGLAITRQYVELMGGELTVESEPGRGSMFRFEIPVEKVAAEDIKQAEPSRGQVIGLEPGQPTYRILIVEDQLENRLLLKKLLEQVGFEVREALNG